MFYQSFSNPFQIIHTQRIREAIFHTCTGISQEQLVECIQSDRIIVLVISHPTIRFKPIRNSEPATCKSSRILEICRVIIDILVDCQVVHVIHLFRFFISRIMESNCRHGEFIFRFLHTTISFILTIFSCIFVCLAVGVQLFSHLQATIRESFVIGSVTLAQEGKPCRNRT